MLHLGFLPYHDAWIDFFKNLRYVVIDEVHTYRGIFGSHMAQVLRRLRSGLRPLRLGPAIFDAPPLLQNLLKLFIRLTNLDVEMITENGAPRPGRHFLFLNPPEGAATTASRIFPRPSARACPPSVSPRDASSPSLSTSGPCARCRRCGAISAPTGPGFLPEERREIEARLASGKMRGVISTSALEMGIDIGGLDVCILVGYPGTMVTALQRMGRVGRQDRDSLVVLVAQPDALDQYFMKHPQEFFGRPMETAVVDPDNPVVVKAHLPCAAQELPLEHGEETVFDLEV
jgi:DEAD/DEAH box helicase domain-containing protein